MKFVCAAWIPRHAASAQSMSFFVWPKARLLNCNQDQSCWATSKFAKGLENFFALRVIPAFKFFSIFMDFLSYYAVYTINNECKNIVSCFFID